MTTQGKIHCSQCGKGLALPGETYRKTYAFCDEKCMQGFFTWQEEREDMVHDEDSIS